MATALQTARIVTGPTFKSQDEPGNPQPRKMSAGAVGLAISDMTSLSGSSSRRPSGQRERANGDKKIVGLRGRQNSLRRVKDSTDLLREKSMQGQSAKIDQSPEHKPIVRDATKARQFTVANVGNNGRIYLRPVQRPQQQPPMPTQASSLLSKTKGTELAVAGPTFSKGLLESRDSVWTLLSHPAHPDQQETKTPESFEMKTRTKRSFSQSTADTQLANERLEAGAFKIVIDRPDSAPSEQDPQDGSLALQVPIPHYRLGTPRFSARGTAFFHQSSYTKSSANGEESSVFSGAEFENIFPKPPGIEAHHVISRRHSYAFHTYPSTPGSASVSPHAYNLYKPKIPITPEVFDMIAAAPNDQSIVKYSPINRDIIAATPARIIMQITSEKFLDYELLSDFFLTVRSYLSTHDLLSYLLARFEWALNRFDDSGRVVRVRAFAALRHWILNYFSYDFVTDRELRVQFCDRLNALTRLLKSQAYYGPSDMKLISDLKKCWNGRCLVYWDNPSVASSESHQEMDIQPGGILGSRDSRLVHQSQLRSSTAASAAAATAPPSLTVNPATIAAGAQSISNWYSAVMEHGERQSQGHTRQSSTGTARSLPISPTSEQSAPILSCSIPAKGLKRAVPYANKALGIQPVPTDTEGRRICPAAPSSLSNEPARPVAVHRRSGSFSDAARDQRAPLSSEVPNSSEAIAQELYHGNSMLRGFVVAPGTPYVVAAPTTPAVEIPQLVSQSSSANRENENPIQRKPAGQKDPHMKSIIGNIRRALSSKHGGPINQAAGVATLSGPTLNIGKSATLPLNVMYQALNIRQMQAFQNQSRIDLLASQVFETWQRVTTAPVVQNTQSIAIALESEPSQHYHSIEQPISMSDSSNHLLLPELPRPELSRLTSGVTDTSRSILIADDTGLNLPDLRAFQNQSHLTHPMAEGETSISHAMPNHEQRFSIRQSLFSTRELDVPQLLAQNEVRSRSAGAEVEGRNKLLASDEFSQQVIRPTHTRNASQLTTGSMRRRASFHSTFAKHNQERSIDTNGASSNASIMAKEAPARMLRRRPGGDLKANQNVHDLEGPIRPRSAGSVTTYAESVRDSQMLGFGEKITRTFTTMRKSPKDLDLAPQDSQPQFDVKNQLTSYIRTHSSQHLNRRPSLEAAVAEFAKIPDDEEGGIEATLLKLEGKYRSPLQSPVPRGLSSDESMKGSKEASEEFSQARMSDDQAVLRESAVESESSTNTVQQDSASAAPQVPLEQSIWQPIALDPVQLQNEPRETVISTVYAGSEDSYNSVPLLERGVDERLSALGKGKERALWDNHLTAREIEKSKKLKRGSIARSLTTDSFLLDENDEFLSDVSSELSLDTVDGEQRAENWTNGEHIRQSENTVLSSQQHPPSPPMTMENAISLESQTMHLQQQRKPPTPDPSPISQYVEPNIPVPRIGLRPEPTPQSRHMPFILGYDSEVLAQQFTILEKEALREIDWRDLVDLRWSNSPASPLNWVDYLSTQDPLGIDLVTARFNVMVKWAISEVVLTEDIEERALCIMKYIHIAQQARKIHNYATLFQITIALTSADCTRLSKTWDLVPTAEKDILQDLEILVSPRRNFHNLRTEMEKANADEGCIPVLALYIHDLTYNAGKPSQLPTVNDGEPLINFERYRSTASIVKNLLQLIDAASKYNYMPVEGLIDRCLWMACLPDETIMQKSKQIASML